MLVREFIQRFLQNHDYVIEQGKTDEQDTLLNFIKERTILDARPSSVIANRVPYEETRYVKKGEHLLGFGRLHCWVMVLAGKREVTESFFIEPSTGCRYSLENSPYQAVDLVFNHYNVWLNLQNKPDSEHGNIDSVSWEFNESSKWEKLFESEQMRDLQSIEDKYSIVNTGLSSSMQANPEGTGGTAAVVPSVESQDENHFNSEILQAVSSAEDVKSRTRSSQRTSIHSNEAMRMCGWMMPLSWVPKLVIPMQAFATR